MVNLMSRELFLKMAVHDLKDNYDYILIDCMPSLGMLTINALAASDEIITPVQAAYLPAKGLEQFLNGRDTAVHGGCQDELCKGNHFPDL